MSLNVIVRLPFYRAENGQFVIFPPMSGKQFGHFDAALPVAFELKRAWHQWSRIALAHDDIALAFERLACIFAERRFRIERIRRG